MIDILIVYLMIMVVFWTFATIFTLISLSDWKNYRNEENAQEVKMFAKMFPIGLVWPFALMYGVYRLGGWTYSTVKEFIHDEGV